MGLSIGNGMPGGRHAVVFNVPFSALDKQKLVLIERASGCNGCALNTTNKEDLLTCDGLACDHGIFITFNQYLTYRLTGVFP